MGRRVAKTRNAGTLSEAGFWSLVRSHLRRGFRWWKPAMQAKQEAKRPYKGKNKRQKWEYQCNKCKKWFPDKFSQVDHIVPVGSLTCSKDLAGFLERLTPEAGFQVLCKPCHQEKTNLERNSK